MIAVFDPPVMARSARKGGGIKTDLTGVISHVLPRRPKARAGILQPG
jgi:hypothetical protein